MTATHYRLRPRPIKVGRQVATTLAALWLTLTALGGGSMLPTVVLAAITLAGGIIADRVGNAYREQDRDQ